MLDWLAGMRVAFGREYSIFTDALAWAGFKGRGGLHAADWGQTTACPSYSAQPASHLSSMFVLCLPRNPFRQFMAEAVKTAGAHLRALVCSHPQRISP